jgi:hypothetical protein
VARFHRRLGEMPLRRLVDAVRAALAERDLDRDVAVLLGGPDLGDAVVRDVEHRHGLRDAVVGKDASHADFAADQSDCHNALFCLTRSFLRAPASIGRHFT